MKFLGIILCLAPIFGVPLPREEEFTCGYEACPILDLNDLNIHIVAHSHDDVGWLKTVDQYYYGKYSNIQFAGVQYILDSVIQALLANPKRKFIQVETAFFHKWWHDRSDQKKEQIRALINNGQLEIVGGGWSMNDEAAAHYHSIIDQFTFGLKYLKDTLGECASPKIGWQIDPFGHTREMASMFAQMGFDALFFARLDYRDKAERLLTRTPEMLWRGSVNSDDGSAIFTHALYDHYSPPKGFYFDVLSDDDSLVADLKSPEYNLEQKMNEFVQYITKQDKSYPSNNIMLTMGNDFTYQDAHYNYKNLDILIQAFNEMNITDDQNRKFKLHYSTPNCYIKAVNDFANQNNVGYKVKTDDFIPYASDNHSYWSGYYTSRPTQKRFERQGNNLLQVVKHLSSHRALVVSDDLNELVDSHRMAMGMMQHHDAITGTEKKAVAKDYARTVFTAYDKSTDIASVVLQELLAKPNQNTELLFKSCFLANITHCEESQKEKFIVAVYNPLSRIVSHHVRLPVDSDYFKITDFNGQEIKSQVTPRIDDFANVPDIHKSKFDLIFFAENLPALGARLYYIVNLKFGQTVADINPVSGNEMFDLGDQVTGVTLNPNTGFLMNIALNKISLNVRQEIMHYIGAIGSNYGSENRSSGAYIFRPDPDNSEAIIFTNALLPLKTYKGDLVDEVHQTFSDWAKQIIRVYKNEKDYVEFDWLVGPIDIDDGNSKEIISRFSFGTANTEDNTFYTDSNGRELMKRINKHRETFNYTDEEKIAGNYYPITSSISLVDPGRRMEISVLTDRAQGGASIANGQIEVMLHRTLLQDDAFGVSEPLFEEEFGTGLRVRGQHFFTFGSTEDGSTIPRGSKMRRGIAQKKILAPWVFVADGSSDQNKFETLTQKLNPEFSLLKRALPDQVQILTLERWADNRVLIRFEHILEISEGGIEVTFEVEDLFILFNVVELEEMTLAANSKLEESSRLKWTSSGCLSSSSSECEIGEMGSRRKAIVDSTVTLKPMEIRTFIAVVESN